MTAFQRVDVLACATLPTVASPLGEHTGDPLAMYLCDVLTIPVNLAGPARAARGFARRCDPRVY